MTGKEKFELSKNYQEAKELLKDKGNLLDTLMVAMGDGLSIQDLDMRIVYQNKFMTDNFGNHTGEYCYFIYERRDKICEGCPIQSAYKDGKVHQALRVGITKDGTPFRFENIASVLKNKQGKIIAGMELCRIIEEREKAKDQLEESEKRFKDVALSMADLVWEVNEKSIYTYCSEKIKDIFGYNMEEVIGKTPFDLMLPEEADRTRKVFSSIAENKGIIKDLESWNITRDGKRIRLFTNGVPVLDEQGILKGYRGVSKDITERKLAEEEKEKLRVQLIQSEKLAAVGQLAGGIAHELNNPMGVILGFAQSIAKGIKDDDPLFMPLKSIEREAVRCKQLIGNLITFSRTGMPAAEKVDINSTIDETLSLIDADVKVKNVQIIKNYGADFPPIMVNKNQIQQVIINLFSNAMDAMPDGGKITISTCIEDKKKVKITVSDTGRGVPKENLNKIFEPFFTTKEVGKGTGLGLSLCYEIIQKHKGSIEVKSEVGKGTAFNIKLPI
ncbi:MAG: ATP-binding protein [bacterium]|nr:ATP-binding protein [bacterium]